MSLKKLCYSGLIVSLVFTSVKAEQQVSHEDVAKVVNAVASISNEEIDRLFIGFEQEERLRLAEEQSAAASIQSPPPPPPTYSNSREILPSDAGLVVGDTKNMMSPPSFDQMGIPPQETESFRISGILCDGSKCEALSTNGTLKVGSEVQSGEKVIKITETMVKTNLREMKF